LSTRRNPLFARIRGGALGAGLAMIMGATGLGVGVAGAGCASPSNDNLNQGQAGTGFHPEGKPAVDDVAGPNPYPPPIPYCDTLNDCCSELQQKGGPGENYLDVCQSAVNYGNDESCATVLKYIQKNGYCSDFSIAATPSSASVNPGGSTEYSVS